MKTVRFNTAQRNCKRSRGLTLAVLTGIFLAGGCGDQGAKEESVTKIQVSRTEQPVVFVSIPPQKRFVQEIGGDRPKIHTLVKPGRSPATYEPTPKQMVALSSAHLYFTIGVPFEDAWLERIQRSNPHMRVVDTSEGIELRPMETHTRHEQGINPEEQHSHGNEDEHGHGHGHEGRKDPHIWLDPNLVKSQARIICNAMSRMDPYNAHMYETNLIALQEKLSNLDNYIRQQLADLKNRTFLVFHPSWGYFATAYNLEQLAVEIEGKEPGGKALAQIIEHAKAAGIKTIFVQPQFSRSTAETIAQAIGARVAVLDPLAEDYFKNMRQAADKMAAKDQP